MEPVQLQVSSPTFEHHHDGLGVSTSRPRISWKVVCPSDQSIPKSWKQQSYAIEIKRSDGESEVKSFQKESADSVLVPWPEEADGLAQQTQAQVRVKVSGKGDGEDAASHESEWSDWANVETGILDRANWKANMIAGPEATLNNEPIRPFRLRKSFQIPANSEKITSARLYATAYGVYEASLNGKVIGDMAMTPGWTSYRHHLNYQIFNVTALLQEEHNILGFEVAEGWYAGRLGWDQKRYHWGDRLGVLAQLEIRYASGDLQTIVSDDSWKWGPSPLTRSELYNGEGFDMCQEESTWTHKDHDDQHWKTASLVDFPTAKLISSDAPPVRVIQEVSPKSISRSPSGKLIFDFGQNLVGKLRIRSFHGAKGERLIMRHAEVLEHGELGTRPLRTAAATDEIIFSGDVLENWSPKFTFHGFRYVQIDGWKEGHSDSFSMENVTALVMHSDMKRTGTFECSHPLINQLHENTVWSMKGNFLSIPTDCPQRDERLGWTGDIQVFSPSANFLFNTTSLLSGWLQDLAAEQADDDDIPPLVVPNVLSNLFEPQPQAVWCDAAVLTPWDLYQASGDIEILRRQSVSMESWVLYGIRRGADGLWDTDVCHLGDWLDPNAPPEDPGNGRTNGTIVADAYLVHITSRLEKISELIGPASAKQGYTSQLTKLRKAFQHKYIAPSGLLVGDTQTALALAIRFNLFETRAQLEVAASRLVQLVELARFRVATGFAGTPIITHALSSTGHVSHAYRMLQEKKSPSWLYPVSMGATTIWERWDSMLPDGSINPGEMTSFNHYALGSIVHWLHAVVGGLRPKEAGWKTFYVEPRPGGTIRSAKTTFESPYGIVSCSWTLKSNPDDETKDIFDMKLTVPMNSEALVILPDKGGIGDEREKFGVVVGSGKYVFSCQLEKDTSWPLAARHSFLAPRDDGDVA